MRKYRYFLEKKKKGKYKNIEEYMENFASQLTHDSYLYLTDKCANKLWLEAFIVSLGLLDHTMHGLQKLYFEMASVLSSEYENKLRRGLGSQKINDKTIKKEHGVVI